MTRFANSSSSGYDPQEQSNPTDNVKGYHSGFLGHEALVYCKVVRREGCQKKRGIVFIPPTKR